MADIVVTGATGYLGYCVIRVLRQCGFGVVDEIERLENLRPRTIHARILIHLAAALRHRASAIYRTNVVGTRCLLRAIAAVEKIIFVSSRAVYAVYEPPRYVNETAVCLPSDAYGWSKLIGEALVKQSGAPYVILRSTSLHGYVPGHKGRNFVARIVEDAYQNAHIPVLGGEQLVDTLYVWDLANLIADLCCPSNHTNLVLNVAGEVAPLQKIIDDVAQVLTEYSLAFTLEYQAPRRQAGVILDTSRLKQHMPHWQPTPMIDTVRDLVQTHVPRLWPFSYER